MHSRLLKSPVESYFLLGLRGVGKSTWAKHAFPNATWFDLLDEGLYQDFLVTPKHFREQLNALPPNSWVVIDEVQRLPNLLNEVHSAIESRQLKFALLGSSARKLRRAGVNLLGGRALRLEMHPLLPTELGSDFSLERMLQYGSLALVESSQDKAKRLQSYVTTYLKEEIQAEAIVRNLPGFARFLRVAALFHGQVLNAQNLARDAGVARTTVDGFLSILEDTLVCIRMRAYEGRLRVKERRHPKLYWLDSGLVRAARNQLGPVGAEERGALFEGLVAQWLLAYRSLGCVSFDDISYWSVGGTEHVEVDFVLECQDELMAIEVKASERLRDDAYVGLRRFSELQKVSKRVLVYLGDQRRRTDDGIDVVPVWEFVHMLASGTLTQESSHRTVQLDA